MAASKRKGLAAKLASRLFVPLLVLSLMLIPLGPTGMLGPARAWTLPSLPGRQSLEGKPQTLTPAPPGGRLQEVPPPAAVQQLQQALAERLPQITISSPRDGATLPDGPWTLKLKLRDWPLVDAGPLGLGAHLVVQIDDLPPERITAGEGQQRFIGSSQGERELALQQAPLSPGSHRVTVYAARPWGEAVKSPGAVRQIRLHHLAANPLSLPAAGTPQLLPVSPEASNGGEPLLLDWLLLDAPLQNLRDGDASWRLKVTINGDTFLVDQAVPLWLRGWKSGRNILQLELVDGIGEPLNPPFNSFVESIDLTPPGAELAAKPRWLQGRLSNDELAILLGDQPPPTPEPEGEPESDTESETTTESDTDTYTEQTLIEPDVAGDTSVAADNLQVTSESAGEPEVAAQKQGALKEPTAEDRHPGVETPMSDQGSGEQGSGQQADNNRDNSAEATSNGDTSTATTASEPDSESESTTNAISNNAEDNTTADSNHENNNTGDEDNDEQTNNTDENSNENNEDNSDEISAEDNNAAKTNVELDANNTIASGSAEGGDRSGEITSEGAIGEPTDIQASNELSGVDASSNSQPDMAGPSDSPPPSEFSPLIPLDNPRAAAMRPLQAASDPVEPIAEQDLTLNAATAPKDPVAGASPEALLGGSARELVNPDGTLIQPAPQGPLTKLRQLLQR